MQTLSFPEAFVKSRDTVMWCTKLLSQNDIEVRLFDLNTASSPFKRVLLNPKARMKNSGSQTFVSMLKNEMSIAN